MENENNRELFLHPEDPQWTDAMIAMVNRCSAECNSKRVAGRSEPEQGVSKALQQHQKRKWGAVIRITMATGLIGLIGDYPEETKIGSMVLLAMYVAAMGLIVVNEVVRYRKYKDGRHKKCW